MRPRVPSTGAAFPGTASDRKLAEMGYDLVAEHRRAVELAGFGPGDPVLDVATGSGRMAFALAMAGCRVVSGDINPEVIRETAERVGALTGDAITFQVFDATRLDLPDGGTTCAVTANALHHMEDPERVLREMTRVVRSDGRVMVVEFNQHGFGVIDRVHRAVHGQPHDPGVITPEAICSFLRSRFREVDHHLLPLDNVWIAARKREIPAEAGPELHDRCFACGQANTSGLKLVFEADGADGVIARCAIDDTYQGYGGVVQGGIVSLLLDSAMTNCLFGRGIQAVTARLKVRFSRPVLTRVPLTVRARWVRNERPRRLARTVHSLRAVIEQEGKERASATGTFVESA